MDHGNQNALAIWNRKLEQLFDRRQTMYLEQIHLLGPFDNTDYVGLLRSYEPEEKTDLNAVYVGKHGPVSWTAAPVLDGCGGLMQDLGTVIPAEAWSVVYLYGELTTDQAQVAQLCFGGPTIGFEIPSTITCAWLNGEKLLDPMLPRQTSMEKDRIFGVLKPGTNQLLVKLILTEPVWKLKWSVASLGQPETVCGILHETARTDGSPVNRLLAKFALAEISAGSAPDDEVERYLDAIASDPLASEWDVRWTQQAKRQKQMTGSFLPLQDLPMQFEPAEVKEVCPTIWPKSKEPSAVLKVLDVSAEAPEIEFAAAVFQGIVNREQPELYLLHSRYARQDRQWLEELKILGHTTREIGLYDAWNWGKGKIKGAVLYDGAVMQEIGYHYCTQLNVTNLVMMLCALEDAIPVTEEMNQQLHLPVVFDARRRWGTACEMTNWAYRELFPRMNQTILATNYPGLFILTDYLVANRIFTFWFPEERTIPEDNLLNGILASTPANTPIIGWWFDWMPNPKDPSRRWADAVMEEGGVMRGSYFGKFLTPSHEAANLTVHSGVQADVTSMAPKSVNLPEADPEKTYFTFMLSDGDNLGEALMLRTRDLHWDQPERGRVPTGWSFAPATAVMAPSVLHYYMRTRSENDLLVGGLGIGYTIPMLYLMAYPEQREKLYGQYGQMTNEALKMIHTSCLWLINGGREVEEIYAQCSDGQLEGLFVGYGGSPKTASMVQLSNQVVSFSSATRFVTQAQREELISAMVEDLRQGARRQHFLEAWVINWAFSLDMLEEVCRRLGDSFACVRPDALVKLARQEQNRQK